MLTKTFIESGTSESFNWSLFIAGLSFFVSIITLYLAHLKGAKIFFVTPHELYPVAGYYSDSNTLEIDILFVNTGIHSGILYKVGILSKYTFVQPQIDTNSEKDSPKVLTPGQEWKGKAQITLGLDGIEGKRYLSSNNLLTLTIEYSHDASFGRQTTSKKDIRIDLRNIPQLNKTQIY